MDRLKLSFIATLIFLTTACGSKKEQDRQLKAVSVYTTQYAKGFSVTKYADYTEVSVRNPWDTTSVLHKYILVDRNNPIPANLPKGTVIEVPVKTALAYSTIHCSALKEIGSLDIINSVCESQYINIDEIKKGISDGRIVDVGNASSPDIEKIIMLSPEVIFASPIMGQTYGNVVKTHIPIIEAVDYTEASPLGQAEWIRFYALFTGKEQIADSLFNITVNKYNRIKETISKHQGKKPTVLTDMKYLDSWNMPGGKSYMANMLSDAGADYIWGDNDSKTFLPLSFEAVLDKGGNADYWLIKYYSTNDMTYESLKKDYRPYTYFKAYKDRHIFACNTSKSTYYIDLPIHPDYILKDMACIFYPNLFDGYKPKYFSSISEQ